MLVSDLMTTNSCGDFKRLLCEGRVGGASGEMGLLGKTILECMYVWSISWLRRYILEVGYPQCGTGKE
jgi:hypothetical protein